MTALFGSLPRLIQHISLLPFDTSTEVGRSKERYRRIALSFSIGVVGRLLTAALSILTVSLTIDYLGPERYGLWLTLSSIVVMMSFADLGIGNGLMTKVAEADGKGDHDEIKRLVSSAFFILLASAAVLSIVTIVLVPAFDWPSMFAVTGSVAREEVRPALLLLALNSYVAMPLTVVQRVQSGLQAAYASALWSIGGTAFALVGLLLAATFKAGLVPLVLMLSVVPTAVTAVNFAWFFGRQMPSVCPRLLAFDRAHAFALLQTGVLFAVLQLASSLAFVSDNYVIARTLGSAAVPILAVPTKLFTLLTLPVSLVMTPLWPAYGEAHARGDKAWIHRALRRSVSGCVSLAAIGGVFLVFTGPLVVGLWTKGQVSPPLTILIPLAIWTCFFVWGQATSAFLNGTGQIRAQAIAGVIMASAAYVMKWWLVGPLGPGGVVWATVGAYFVFNFLPMSLIIRSSLRRMDSPMSVTSS